MAGKSRVAPVPLSSGQTSEFSDEQLMDVVTRIVNVYVRIGNRKFGCSMPVPSIGFDLCDKHPSWAGSATSDLRVDFNLILLRDNVEHMLNQVVQHEIAHSFQHHLFDRKGKSTQAHGAEWQEIMRQLGKDPFKYHALDTTKAKEHYKQVKKAKKG